MGFKTQLVAVGNELPRLARARYPEGGREAATAAATDWFTDRVTGSLDSADMAHGGYPMAEDEIWVSTFGPVIIFGGDVAVRERERLIAEASRRGLSCWELIIHSVVDLCEFTVRTPDGSGDRQLSIFGDSEPADVEAMAVGAQLPFEVPYWSGEHRMDDEEYPFPFHPLELGEAALAWIFGLAGEGAPDDGVQRALGRPTYVDDVPMHGFTVARAAVTAVTAVTAGRTPSPTQAARRPRWWTRLLGR